MKKKALQISPPLATPSEEIDMQGFLVLRVKTYYFRRKVPVELLKYFPPGSKEIWRSLGTSDKRLANSACREWIAKTERVFATLKMAIPDEMKIEFVKSEIQPSSSAVLSAPAPTSEKGLTYLELVEEFVNHKKGIWSLKSKQENEYTYKVLFPSCCGNPRVSKIDYKLIEAYREKLKQIPANHTRLVKYKDKTIQELLDMPASEKDMPKPQSVNKHVGFLVTLFKFAIRRQHMTFNPAEDVKVKVQKGVKANDERKRYEPEDMQDIINLLRYNEKYPERLFVPLISIFTGMRRGEACQLYVTDIKFDEESDIPYFQCEETLDVVEIVVKGELVEKQEKNLKQAASWRIIPIHPFLWEDLGLRGYAEQCKKSGQKRLFPSLKPSRDGYGVTFSRHFDRNIARRIAPAYSGKSFHSFRHSFIDWFKQSKIEGYDRGHAVEIIREFVGHAYNSNGSEDLTLERYGKRYPIQTLASVLFQLDYNLNFDNITEQVGSLVAIGTTAVKQSKLRPDFDYPTEVEGP